VFTNKNNLLQSKAKRFRNFEFCIQHSAFFTAHLILVDFARLFLKHSSWLGLITSRATSEKIPCL
jgi:hypothetical protein